MEIRKDPTTLITLIISILVFLFSALFGYMASNKNEEYKPELAKKIGEMQEQKKIFETSRDNFYFISKLAGWWGGGETEKVTSYDKMADDLNALNQKLKDVYKIDTQLGEWEIKEFHMEKVGLPLIPLVEKMEEITDGKRKENDDNISKFNESDAIIEKYLGPDGKIIQNTNEKMEEMKRLQTRLDAKQEEVMEIIRKGEENFMEKTRIIEGQRESIYKVKEEKGKEYKELEAQKDELQKRFDVMTLAVPLPKEGIDVDGKIQRSFPETMFAYVDIGRKDCLFPGTAFDVYRLLKDGVPRRIGSIRILEVLQDDLSKAAVISTITPDTQIAANDYVANPKFDKNSPKVFVIAGRLKRKYSNETVTQKLAVYGWKVESAVTIYTTYIVLGDGFQDSPEFKKAQKFGIATLSELELLQLLD